MTVEEFAGSCRQIDIHAWDFKVIESETDDQLFNPKNGSFTEYFDIRDRRILYWRVLDSEYTFILIVEKAI